MMGASYTVALAPGWAESDEALRVDVRGRYAFLTGRVARSDGLGLRVGSLPAEARPMSDCYASVTALASSGADAARFTLKVDARGDITVAHVGHSPVWGAGQHLPVNMVFEVA